MFVLFTVTTENQVSLKMEITTTIPLDVFLVGKQNG